MAETQNPAPEIPPGMMRVWDAEQKKVILVTAPPAGPDRLKLTIRLHDPMEKKNAALAASWITADVPREDLALATADFIAKHITPKIPQLAQIQAKQKK